jgi:DNA adenine methylase
MRKCNHSWLITYDDSPQIRENFKFSNIYDWELQYGMNNYKQDKADKGSELFISNYKLPIKQKSEPTEEQKIEQLRLI